MERRAFKRKQVETLEVTNIVESESLKKVCKRAQIIDTSIKGFLILIAREDIISNDLKGNLTLDSMKGLELSLYVEQMELELDGTIGLTRHIGKGLFEVLVNFSNDTPTYWRECLMDLLPHPGELND